MQAKCTAAREQVNMLCTDTDTPGRSRGLWHWEGYRATNPGFTDTHTHAHQPLRAAPTARARAGAQGLGHSGVFSLLDTVRRHGHGPLERNWRKNL